MNTETYKVAEPKPAYVKRYKKSPNLPECFSVKLYRVIPDGDTPRFFSKLYQAQSFADNFCFEKKTDCDIEKVIFTKKNASGDYEYFTPAELFCDYANYTAGLSYTFVDFYEKTYHYVESFAYITEQMELEEIENRLMTETERLKNKMTELKM